MGLTRRYRPRLVRASVFAVTFLLPSAASAWADASATAVATHTIIASAGANGSIAPSGAVVVDDGANQGFTITPDAHFHILEVKVDGVSRGEIPDAAATKPAGPSLLEATGTQIAAPTGWSDPKTNYAYRPSGTGVRKNNHNLSPGPPTGLPTGSLDPNL